MDRLKEQYAISITEWGSLSADLAEEFFRLRQDVFVIEQNCPYNDLDGWDPKAWHVMCHAGNDLASYCRVFAAGVFPPIHPYQEPDDGQSARIGRIVTAAPYRSQGLAARLVQRSFDFIQQNQLGENVRIAAQRHLSNYYGQLGFREIGEPYIEDDIPHIDMIMALKDR